MAQTNDALTFKCFFLVARFVSIHFGLNLIRNSSWVRMQLASLRACAIIEN